MREALQRLGERIAESAAHLDAAMHRLLTDLREFDEQRGWYEAGAKSCAHWLSWRVGWDLSTARERVRVARRLGELPVLDAALSRGEVSYSKLRAMTRVATSANESLLLTYAEHAPAAQLETICRKYQLVLRLAEDHDGQQARREVTRRSLDDGMVKVEAVLRPEEAAALWAAIGQAAKDVSAETFRRPDGIVALAQTYLRGNRPDRAPVEITVAVSAEALRGDGDEPAQLGDGTHVSAETARRIACDAAVVEIVDNDDGQVLSVGRRSRSIPTAIRRALEHRDDTCRFPGCNNRAFLDGHHIKHWAKGGETKLGNLVLLCSHHHIAVHELGFRVELDDEHQPHFFDPAGRRVLPVPPRPTLKQDCWAALEEANRQLELGPWTNLPRWDGEPTDYDACVDALIRADR